VHAKQSALSGRGRARSGEVAPGGGPLQAGGLRTFHIRGRAYAVILLRYSKWGETVGKEAFSRLILERKKQRQVGRVSLASHYSHPFYRIHVRALRCPRVVAGDPAPVVERTGEGESVAVHNPAYCRRVFLIPRAVHDQFKDTRVGRSARSPWRTPVFTLHFPGCAATLGGCSTFWTRPSSTRLSRMN